LKESIGVIPRVGGVLRGRFLFIFSMDAVRTSCANVLFGGSKESRERDGSVEGVRDRGLRRFEMFCWSDEGLRDREDDRSTWYVSGSFCVSTIEGLDDEV
jgi:hypothetical protein